MAHVTYVPCSGWSLLDLSLRPSLALQQPKRDVAFAEGKSCFTPTLSLPIIRLCSHACAFLVRLQEEIGNWRTVRADTVGGR